MQTAGRLAGTNMWHGNANAATDLYNVEDPGPNDVLFGRGTGSNMHSGNIRFRALIQKYKPVYRDTPKKMKPSVSTKVVAIWRSQDPPGRFLTRSDRFHGSRRTFYDVGDAMARRKAAQCLREKSSKERLQQQQQQSLAGTKRPLDEEEEEEQDASNNSTEEEEGVELGISVTEQAPVTSISSSTAASSTMNQEFSANKKQKTENTTTNSSVAGWDEPTTVASIHNEIMNFGVLPNMPQGVLDNDFPLPTTTVQQKSSDELSKMTPPEVPSKVITLPSAALTKTLKNATSLSSVVVKAKHQLPEFSWLGSGSPKNDPMSLFDVYSSNQESEADEESAEDRNGSSDSPFLFASFDLGGSNNNSISGDADSEDGGGLCFPSLFGGGGSSEPAPKQPSVLPPLPSVSVPTKKPNNNNNKAGALQTIRDAMPTAASLTTTSLFDW